jgi:hypothetical protein
VVAAIIEAAKTGEVGDGKIFVMSLDHAVRIQAPPSAVANEPIFDETRRVALDELSMGADLEAPE